MPSTPRFSLAPREPQAKAVTADEVSASAPPNPSPFHVHATWINYGNDILA
jgi:hypothetical protein